MKQIALLRGINVGGNKLIPMKELAALFTSLGCTNVVTLIQSGNVVFDVAKPAGFADRASAGIKKKFGFAVPVILRRADDLNAVVSGNPWLKKKVGLETLHVGFLMNAPTKEMIATLEPKRSETDQFEVRGAEIFFHFPKGLGKSKFTNAFFDSRLKTVCTVRNWNTVLKLQALSAA